MNEDIQQAVEAIRRCRELRKSKSVEAVLRSELQSHLRRIFPAKNNENWLNYYSSGTEAKTKIKTKEALIANRFIDNLIGCTTIEYEADLRIKAKFKGNYSPPLLK